MNQQPNCSEIFQEHIIFTLIPNHLIYPICKWFKVKNQSTLRSRRWYEKVSQRARRRSRQMDRWLDTDLG